MDNERGCNASFWLAAMKSLDRLYPHRAFPDCGSSDGKHIDAVAEITHFLGRAARLYEQLPQVPPRKTRRVAKKGL